MHQCTAESSGPCDEKTMDCLQQPDSYNDSEDNNYDTSDCSLETEYNTTKHDDNDEPAAKRIKYDTKLEESGLSREEAASCSSLPQEENRKPMKIRFPMLKKNLQKQHKLKKKCERVKLKADTSQQSPKKSDTLKPKPKTLKKVSAKKYVRKPQKVNESVKYQLTDLLLKENSSVEFSCKTSVTEEDSKKLALDSNNNANVLDICYSSLSNQSGSIVSLTHRELMFSLKEAGAIDSSDQLMRISTAALSVKLVMAAVNVLNFSYTDICLWVISSRKTKYSAYNEKFTKQFDVFKDLYRLICCNIDTPNGKYLLYLTNATKYRTPWKMSSWRVIFSDIPYLLENVALSSSIQEQSTSLSSVSLKDACERHAAAAAQDTAGSSEDTTFDRDETDRSMETSLESADDLTMAADTRNVVMKSVASQADSEPVNLSTEQINKFLSNIEDLIHMESLPTNSNPSDILQRMAGIEQHLALEDELKSSEVRHQILSQSYIQETKFKKNVAQLNKALNYVSDKCDSLDKSLCAQKTMKQNTMILYQSDRNKTQKISFLRSKVHLLGNVIGHCMDQVLSQKRVTDVIKAKLVSLEKCYFSQRSMLSDKAKLTAKISHLESCIKKDTAQSGNTCTIARSCADESKSVKVHHNMENFEQKSTFSEKYMPDYPGVSDWSKGFTQSPCTSGSSERYIGRDQNSLGTNDGSYGGDNECYNSASGRSYWKRGSNGHTKRSGFDANKRNSEIGVQCDLVFEKNIVLRLPTVVTSDEYNMTEVSNVKKAILKSAAATSKLFHKGRSSEYVFAFKNVIDKLILYELLIDNKNSLGLFIQMSFSHACTRPCNIFSEKDLKRMACVEVDKTVMKKPVPQTEFRGSFESPPARMPENKPTQISPIENKSVRNQSDQNVSGPVLNLTEVEDPQVWRKLDMEDLNKVVNGLASYLLVETNVAAAIQQEVKQKLLLVINDKEKYENEIRGLQYKISLERDEHNKKMKELQLTLHEVSELKLKNLKRQHEILDEEQTEKFEKNVHQYKETIDKYSDVINQYENDIQELETYQNNIVTRDELLNKRLDSVRDIIAAALGDSYSNTDQTKLNTTNNEDILARVATILHLSSKVNDLKHELDETKNTCEAITSLHSSLDSLAQSVIVISSQLNNYKEKHATITTAIDEFTEKFTESMQKMDEEQLKVILVKEELLLSDTKLEAADRQIQVLVSNLETMENSSKCRSEQLSAKVSLLQEEFLEKAQEVDLLKNMLVEEKVRSVAMQNKLSCACSEIDKLAVVWEVLETGDTGPSIDPSKVKAAIENKGISDFDMAVLEKITSWKSKQSNTVNCAVNNDLQDSDAKLDCSVEYIPRSVQLRRNYTNVEKQIPATSSSSTSSVIIDL